MPKGWKLAGSPDRSTFAIFVCVKKRKIFVISWNKSLVADIYLVKF